MSIRREPSHVRLAISSASSRLEVNYLGVFPLQLRSIQPHQPSELQRGPFSERR